MGVALPQFPLDKPNFACEVGWWGLYNKYTKPSGKCLSHREYAHEAEDKLRSVTKG